MLTIQDFHTTLTPTSKTYSYHRCCLAGSNVPGPVAYRAFPNDISLRVCISPVCILPRTMPVSYGGVALSKLRQPRHTVWCDWCELHRWLYTLLTEGAVIPWTMAEAASRPSLLPLLELLPLPHPRPLLLNLRLPLQNQLLRLLHLAHQSAIPPSLLVLR